MTIFDMIIYLVVISILAIVVTCYDKIASKQFKKHRIPENVLLFISIIGGSVSMFFTMLVIHHKTKHRKFMIGIPIIIIIEIAALISLNYYFNINY